MGTGLDKAGRQPVEIYGRIPQFYPDSNFLFDDDFSNGFSGWVPLLDQTIGGTEGTLSLSPVSLTGPYSLMLATGRRQRNTEPWGRCCAIKRCTRPREGNFTFDLWLDFSGPGAYDKSPRDIEIGIDTQRRSDNQRCYFRVRWHNYDETSQSNPRNWQITVDPGELADIPDSTMLLPWNQNKHTFVYIALTVDLTNMQYKTLRVFEEEFDLSSYTPYISSTVLEFDGGLNCSVAVNNTAHEAADQDSQAWVHIDRARGYFV